MRTRALLPALAAVLLAAGCYRETKLQPLPAVQTTKAGSAVAEAQGVRLVADGDSWRGTPSDLERAVTPVEVRFENQSGRTLRIKYEDFVLVGDDSHFKYAALSPFEMRDDGLAIGGSGSTTGKIAPAGGVSVGVGVGYGAWGPWGPGWGDPFYRHWYDPFYGPYYGPYSYWGGPYWYYPPEPLPTRDMLRRALPEGTLESGGTITGFLYFQSVSGREGSVTLQARLVDASTGEQFGTLSIPFGVRT